MKTRLLNISLLVVLLVGCAPAARSVSNQADDAVRLFGDDIARFATKYGDDVARTSQQYADDVGRQTQYSDEALRYWDEVIRSSQLFDEGSLRLLYQNDNLSPLQDDFVRWLRAEANLSENESLLYLQSVCSIANYVQFYIDYPSKSYTQFYVEQVAAENGILIFSIADFSESALSYTTWLIEGDGSYSRQEGASLLFEGLCLVSDVLDE
jgi:hypothetical protein